MNERELAQRLDHVARAEDRLRTTVESLDDAGLGEPSLLPGWTKGHVLAHVTLNAHSLVNLFEWARTGIETPQYPSWEARDAGIERCSTRTAAEHLSALAAAGDAFAGAARAVPLDRWTVPVSGIGGDPVPAEVFLFGRLREVEIHHVDLGAGYAPGDWSGDFVRTVLDEVPGRLGDGVDETFRIEATDLQKSLVVGDGSPERTVSGAGAELLAWLLGRADGSRLTTSGALPRVPPWG